MADQKTTDAALTGLVKTMYNKRFIERLVPEVKLYQFADKQPLTNAKTIEFTGYRNIKPIVANSGELSSTQAYLSAYTISSTVVQRHNYVQVSTLLKQTSIDPNVMGAVDALATQMGTTVEIFIRQQVVGLVGNATRSSTTLHDMNVTQARYDTNGTVTGTSAQRTHHFYSKYPLLHNKARLSSSGADICVMAGSAASLNQIKYAVTYLRARNVMPYDGQDYIFYCHPWVADKLMADPKWATWNANNSGQNAEKMFRGEVGRAFGARIVTSNAAFRYVYSAAPLTTASGAFNASFIFGKDAFSTSEITNGDGGANGFKIIVKTPGPNSTNDPVDLINTVGGKMTMAATVRNKSAGAIVITTDKVVSSAS